MRPRHVGLLLALTFLAGYAAFAQQNLDQHSLELLGPPAGSARSGAQLERVTEEVTSLMRCPVCQGLSVADSPTPSALAMKAQAEKLLATGYDQEQVLAYFESSYGEFIRLAPKARGFNLFVWLLPAVALLLGGGLIWWRLRPGTVAGPVESVDSELDEYLARVRRDTGS